MIRKIKSLFFLLLTYGSFSLGVTHKGSSKSSNSSRSQSSSNTSSSASKNSSSSSSSPSSKSSGSNTSSKSSTSSSSGSISSRLASHSSSTSNKTSAAASPASPTPSKASTSTHSNSTTTASKTSQPNSTSSKTNSTTSSKPISQILAPSKTNSNSSSTATTSTPIDKAQTPAPSSTPVAPAQTTSSTSAASTNSTSKNPISKILAPEKRTDPASVVPKSSPGSAKQTSPTTQSTSSSVVSSLLNLFSSKTEKPAIANTPAHSTPSAKSDSLLKGSLNNSNTASSTPTLKQLTTPDASNPKTSTSSSSGSSGSFWNPASWGSYWNPSKSTKPADSAAKDSKSTAAPSKSLSNTASTSSSSASDAATLSSLTNSKPTPHSSNPLASAAKNTNEPSLSIRPQSSDTPASVQPRNSKSSHHSSESSGNSASLFHRGLTAYQASNPQLRIKPQLIAAPSLPKYDSHSDSKPSHESFTPSQRKFDVGIEHMIDIPSMSNISQTSQHSNNPSRTNRTSTHRASTNTAASTSSISSNDSSSNTATEKSSKPKPETKKPSPTKDTAKTKKAASTQDSSTAKKHTGATTDSQAKTTHAQTTSTPASQASATQASEINQTNKANTINHHASMNNTEKIPFNSWVFHAATGKVVKKNNTVSKHAAESNDVISRGKVITREDILAYAILPKQMWNYYHQLALQLELPVPEKQPVQDQNKPTVDQPAQAKPSQAVSTEDKKSKEDNSSAQTSSVKKQPDSHAAQQEMAFPKATPIHPDINPATQPTGVDAFAHPSSMCSQALNKKSTITWTPGGRPLSPEEAKAKSEADLKAAYDEIDRRALAAQKRWDSLTPDQQKEEVAEAQAHLAAQLAAEQAKLPKPMPAKESKLTDFTYDQLRSSKGLYFIERLEKANDPQLQTPYAQDLLKRLEQDGSRKIHSLNKEVPQNFWKQSVEELSHQENLALINRMMEVPKICRRMQNNPKFLELKQRGLLEQPDNNKRTQTNDSTNTSSAAAEPNSGNTPVHSTAASTTSATQTQTPTLAEVVAPRKPKTLNFSIKKQHLDTLNNVIDWVQNALDNAKSKHEKQASKNNAGSDSAAATKNSSSEANTAQSPEPAIAPIALPNPSNTASANASSSAEESAPAEVVSAHAIDKESNHSARDASCVSDGNEGPAYSYNSSPSKYFRMGNGVAHTTLSLQQRAYQDFMAQRFQQEAQPFHPPAKSLFPLNLAINRARTMHTAALAQYASNNFNGEPSSSSQFKNAHEETQRKTIQEFDNAPQQIDAAIKESLESYKNNFHNDLQLCSLFKEASDRLAYNANNSYTKACVESVESACMLSFDLKGKGFAYQASAIRNLADALNIASTRSNILTATSIDQTPGARACLEKAMANIQNIGAETKDTFIKAYRDFKAQPTEAKIRDVAVATVAVMLAGSTVSPLLVTAIVDHVAFIISTEVAAIGATAFINGSRNAQSPITCSIENIADDVSSILPPAWVNNTASSAQGGLPATATTFQAPAVIQPSVMAGHASTLQAGANALVSSAASGGQAGLPIAQPQIVTNIDPSVGTLQELENIVQAVKEVPGAIGKDGAVTKLLECGSVGNNSGNLATARGAAYELRRAYDLKKSGENIIKFGEHLGIPQASSREFDIITQSKLIECKAVDWSKLAVDKINDMKSIFKQQLNIAKHHGKDFQVHSKYALPNELKNWFNIQGIKFFEG